MLLNIIKFATVGIKFTDTITVPTEVLQRRLVPYTPFNAILGKNERLIARFRGDRIKLYRLGVPILILGKPVLYVHVIASESGTLVAGRFTFSVFSRAFFWLAHIVILGLLGIGFFRIAIAQTHDEPMVWYMYGVFALLIGGMLSFLVYSWYSWTWHNRREDLITLAQAFKLTLRENAIDSNVDTQ